MTTPSISTGCHHRVLQSKLQELGTYSDTSIEKEIIVSVLDSYQTNGEVSCFFSDLAYSGCESGMVSDLIYTVDCHAFFDRHYDRIEAIRETVETNLGQPLAITGDLKTFLAWLAFEEVAFELAREVLGLDL